MGDEHGLTVNLFSFGFKHGPAEADTVLDVRFLPNPYWVDELRPRSGRDPEVAAHVLDNERGRAFLRRLEPLVLFLCGQFTESARDEFTLAIGCTGGRHRSVATVEYLRHVLDRHGFRPNVFHRDIDKK